MQPLNLSAPGSAGLNTGYELPAMRSLPAHAAESGWAERALRINAPMGPGMGRLTPGLIFARALGANVIDTEGNRYVDLVAGFGAQLLGHCHPELTHVIADQAARLTQALGDLYPCTEKIELQEKLADLLGPSPHQVILGQSGADAVTAALKTALLATGHPGVVAFGGAYHGLSYAPLALCQLRESYRQPFADQLSGHVHVLPYPTPPQSGAQALSMLDALLRNHTIGAVIIEPILGRGGCLVPPEGFLQELVKLCRDRGALSIFDEILTGLGRSGTLLQCRALQPQPDVVCVGKGLGGGLPISACIAGTEIMKAWAQEAEVVHTSTFAGTPLAAVAAVRLLDILQRDRIVEQTCKRGHRWLAELRGACAHLPQVREIRGQGLLIGLDVGPKVGTAVGVCQRLLSKGWIASTGGGAREVVVLTPPLTITDELIDAATQTLQETLQEFPL